MTSRREWPLRLLVGVGIPVLFFVLLEAGLRVAQYGYDTSFFIRQGGVYTDNPRFGFRFFPRALARSPYPFNMSADKSPDTYRIFVLGDSAALGDPDPAFGFARILQQMLSAHEPGRHFEVVNVAMTAINSHVSLAIARECARQHPDLFLVYMGNNEVVGPFGPGTVFDPFMRNRTLIQGVLALKATRTGQLLNFRARAADRKTWSGMGSFTGNRVPAGDPRLEAVYRNFRDNLADICRVGRSAGARVIVSTVASNVKDCAPFASLHRGGLGDGAKARWDAHFDAGVRAQESGDHEAAARSFEQAAEIDSTYAELQFRLAQVRLALGDAARARHAFVLARDLDALRFRADTAINRAIREVAVSKVIDSERLFSEASPSGIPGEELFLEHVHMNFTGNYLLARAAFERITTRATALSERECAERLGFTAWDRYQIASEALARRRRPPFTLQFDQGERCKRAERELAELRNSDAREIVERYTQAAARAPQDWAIAEHYAGFLHAAGDLEASIGQFRKEVELVPRYALGHTRLCLTLADAGWWNEAEQQCSEAVELEPHAAEGYYNLGNVHFRRGDLDSAAAQYRVALTLQPDLARAHCNLGAVLTQQHRLAEAIAEFRAAVRLDRQDVHAHNGLGAALAIQGNLEEAAEEYQTALRLEPSFVQAHRNLAQVLNSMGKSAEAADHLRQAQELGNSGRSR